MSNLKNLIIDDEHEAYDRIPAARRERLNVKRVLSYMDYILKMVWHCQTTTWDGLGKQIELGGSLRKPDTIFSRSLYRDQR